METLIETLLPQAPTVGVMLMIFWQLRHDVNAHMIYLEQLIEKLIDTMIDSNPE